MIDKEFIELKRLAVDLNKVIHDEIKKRAIDRGMTIRQWIEEAIVNQIRLDEGLGWK